MAKQGGFDVGNLAGTLISTFLGIGFAKNDAKKQRQLQEKIANMSLENQQAIANRLAEAQTNIEKQRIAFQILALENNANLVRELEGEKNKSLIVLGVGAIALAVVIVLAKFKK